MSVDFCDARQGGGAYGKTPAVLASSGALLDTLSSLPALPSLEGLTVRKL
ncbi:hypothetical protein EC970007_5384, partial [Escherichia coli 97.0007]